MKLKKVQFIPLSEYPVRDKRIIINTDILLGLYLDKKRCNRNANRQKNVLNPRVRASFWEQASNDYQLEIIRLEKHISKI